MKNLQITAYTQHFIRQQVMPGDICIDATMGNGNDTALLSQLAGKRGRVLAFDIQKQALEHTKERLKRDNCPENYQLLPGGGSRKHVYPICLLPGTKGRHLQQITDHLAVMMTGIFTAFDHMLIINKQHFRHGSGTYIIMLGI